MTEDKDKNILDEEQPCCGEEEGDKEEKEVGEEKLEFIGDLEEIFGKIDFAKEAERDESIRIVLKAFKDDLEGKSEDTLKHFQYLYDLYIGNPIK